MAQQKAKYRGQRFNVVSKDQKYTILEGHGYSVRVLNDEVIYEEPVVDVLPQAKPEDKLQSSIPDAPLPKELPEGKDIIPTNEETTTTNIARMEQDKAKKMGEIADLNKKQATEKAALAKAELAAAKKVVKEDAPTTDPIATPENETQSGYYVTYSDARLANSPLEKNRIRVGAIPKFGNRQYVPGRSKATVIWYDNKNNPEEIDISMLKPLPTATAKEEIQKQNLNEEIEWDKYKANDVDVNPETHEDTKKTNDERMSTALTGLQASFRKMLEEIDQVLEAKNDLSPISISDYASEQIHNDEDKVSDDVNYNDLENHYDNLDVATDTSFEQVDELDEDEDSYLVDNNVSIMYDGTNYWYEMYEPKPEMNEAETVEPKEKSDMFCSVREAYQSLLSKTTDLSELENLKGRDIEINGDIFSVNPEFKNGRIQLTKDNGEMSFISQIKLLSLLKSGEAKILDVAMNECGTAAVAGPGAADGTVNQAVNATQGIATVPSRLGDKLTSRKLEESIFTTDELKLKDSGYPKIDLSKLKK
jgi:hypothetical protein